MADQEKLLQYLRRVTSDLADTRSLLQQEQAAAREPIAVVAAGCRFPGGVSSPEELWSLVAAGRDAITEIPGDRGWDQAEMGGDVGHGGFLADPLTFDAAFFGISPREALGMDPQQRLLLEVAWETVERGRIDPVTLRGSRTGVFIGIFDNGYSELLRGAAADVGGYVLTGCTTSVASGRIAYVLGLEGPAVTVNTACSSSLVAMHAAVQSLRQGDCDMAMAGGATVMSTPLPFAEFSRQGVLSADGRCRAFADGAAGIGLAEGVGLLLLERVTDARRNGHPVLALVRGSAVNSDGASNGLTAPNGPSQQRVIRQALANAGLSPDQVDLVEGHGTGTKLGDPVEVQALLATYGSERRPDRPLWLGSVKSNIGHTQAASGVAGVIKVLGALRHELLPPTRYASAPSPLVDWAAGGLALVTEPTPWLASPGVPRRAAISSFGISGTNAHLILEAPEPAVPASGVGGEPSKADQAAIVWPLSGRDDAALRMQAERLSGYLAANPGIGAADVGYALATSRAAQAHRAVILGADRNEMVKGLGAVARGRVTRTVVKSSGPTVAPGQVAFVFAGQGGQWPGMAVELMDGSPVFRRWLESCAEALAPYIDWSVIDVLRGAADAPPLEQPPVIQTALFAMMVSLAELWRAHGVEPAAVVGHSQGEIVAACVAGALSLEEAARVVSLRSQVAMDVAGQGGLVALNLSEGEARERVARWGDALSIGVINSPRSVVVAGAHVALDELLASCADDGVRARRVSAAYASHSPQMEALRDRLHEVLGKVTAGPARIPFYSTVTGQVLPGSRLNAAYWYRNQREPVLFEAATRRLLEDGFRTFIEVSPHPLLIASIEETVEAYGSGGVIAVGTLRRDDGGSGRLRRSMAEAFVRGAEISWAFQPGRGIDLPVTAFLGERYWPEGTSGQGTVAPGSRGGDAEHEFWAAVDTGDLARVASAIDAEGEMSAERLIASIGDWYRRRAVTSAIDEWRYQVSWSPRPSAQVAAGSLAGSWLVAIPAGSAGAGIAEAVTAMFARDGCDVRWLPVAAGEVAPEAVADALAGIDPAGVFSLLALDESALPDHNHVAAGLAGTHALLRALGELGISAPLWAATQGAVSVSRNDRLASPVQAAVWGLGRVAALEHPDRWGGLIDLPETFNEDACARLARVLMDSAGEDQLAVRASGVFARRLRRARAGAPAAGGRWCPRGTVLITGGTGALGGHVARRLARNGVAHLVLTSRSGEAAPGAAELASELRALGARVSVVACDAADPDALRSVVSCLAAEGSQIRTVIHTAATAALAPLAEATREELADAMAGKVAGARNLDELFGDGDLDDFVVFSSGSGVWGAGGQGTYAAANAALDALAEYRRARGLPAISLAWGLWEGDGMARGDTGVQLRRRGMGPMTPDYAVTALTDAVLRDEGNVVVADIRWEPFLTGFTSARASRLFDDIPEARAAASAMAVVTPADGTPLGAALRTAGPAELRGMLDDLIATNAAAVLNLPDASALSPGRAFRDLGFDSLTAVEMRNRLVAATGLPLPTTVVFDHPTAGALAAHLRAELGGGHAPASAPSAVPAIATAAELAPDDDLIAIVGIACRFPGGANDPEQLWRLVDSGVDAMGAFPADRGWDLDAIAGHCVPEGGFLHDAADFDASFFGLSPREAIAMDPQQRLVLETSWEALERAAIDPRSLRGSRAAVVIGLVSQDYAEVLRDASEADGYRITGGSAAVVSGRVAYFLGLEGQALTVDTACSSSLVAIHLASQILRRGEATLALAGGVTVMATPTPFLEFSKQQGLSSDGRCHSFAASADGTGWGEGAGVLVLQRLPDARRQRRDVLAVIRGSALNQDGASNGLTAPSGPAQQEVIREALAAAGLAARDVDAVEAHGTATTLGDPIEARAIIATYGRDREEGSPLWLGSLKSNIGHTQAAAGVGGVIKMVQALRHEKLPATLHVDAPTPHVDWSGDTVRLLTEPVAWPRSDRPRRAAVSAFGISGTNAHLILEEGQPPAPPSRAAAGTRAGSADLAGPQERSPVIPVPVSGHTRTALVAQAARLACHLESSPRLAVSDVAHSLFTTRAQLAERSVVLAGDRNGLLEALTLLGDDGRPASVVSGTARDRPKVALLLPGQGSQRIGLGRELHAAFPGYAAAFDAICAHFDPHLDRPLSAVLFAADDSPESALLDQTRYAQPALFATGVALGRLLEEFGVQADVLLGHSIGEIAAAHLASALSLEDSCALVAARGRLMQAQPAGGAMVAVEASEQELRAALADGERQVALAAVNGPAAVVISGDTDSVLEVAAAWKARGRRIKRLNVSHAFHSPHMEGVMTELGWVVDGLTWSPPEVPVISNLTGQPVTVSELSSPAYWARQARQTVRFGDGVRWLAQHGVSVAIELGGDGTLCGLVKEGLGARLPGADPLGPSLVAVPALRTPRPEAEAFTTALSQLHVQGVKVNLAALLATLGCPPPAVAVPLPTTVFQRQRYWLQARPVRRGAGASGGGLDALRHPVLTAALPVADAGGWIFAGRLSRHEQAWLADHVIEGTAVVPGIALLELALRAGRQIGYPRADELTFLAPVRLPDEGGVDVQVRVAAPEVPGGCPVTIRTRVDGSVGWTHNATGRLTRARSRDDVPDLRAWPPPGAEAVPADELYQRLAGYGFTFGPAYRSLRAAWRRDEEWFTEVRLPVEYQPDARRFEIHPALLDSAGHLALETLAVTEAARPGEVLILFAVEGVQVDAPGAATLRARITLREHDTMEMVLADGSGELIARVDGLTVRPVTARLLPSPASLPRDALFALRWSPRPAPAGPAPSPERWATVGPVPHADGVARAYQDLAALTAALTAGQSPPDFVLACLPASEPDETAGPAEAGSAIRRAIAQALALVKAFLAEHRLDRARLVLVTDGAVTTGAGDRLRNVPGAGVWGLLRVAQSEHPDRFVLADVDGDPASWHALPAAVCGGGQQLALRAGLPWVPFLTPVPASSAPRSLQLHPAGTVLVTGASGALGGQVARHLVSHRGARNLLLVGRTGRDDRRLAGLAAELEQAGALVTVAACDVADRAALARILDAIPPQRPLTGIFHAAGVLSDGLLTSLTDERVDEVLRPKADGALNLLDLTRDAALAEIVLFSSAVSIVGNVGQGNYAAANAVLDALAEQGRAQDVPARSLAWGPWAGAGGMAGRLDPLGADRVRRLHVLPLSVPDGLALLDATAGVDLAVTLPMRVDTAALAADQSAAIPALLRGLSPAEPPDPAATAGRPRSLRDRLAGLDEESRGRAVLDVVRTHVARVLGHGDAQVVDPGRPFLDLGFNSLMAVELRDELSTTAGLRLPATLVFEFPTPAALTRHLLAVLTQDRASEPSPAVFAPDIPQPRAAADAAPDGERTRPILALEPI